MMQIRLDQVWGFAWALRMARLSWGVERSVAGVVWDDGAELLDGSDLALALKLVQRGPSHAKFLRCVVVWATIRAPRAWWTQFDTYKVGTTALSQSTMHTLLKRPLAQDDFAAEVNPAHLEFVNQCIATGDLRAAKVNLPEGFQQVRGVCLNYQVLRRMYHQRREHRLEEWQEFCEWLEKVLPHSELITVG